MTSIEREERRTLRAISRRETNSFSPLLPLVQSIEAVGWRDRCAHGKNTAGERPDGTSIHLMAERENGVWGWKSKSRHYLMREH